MTVAELRKLLEQLPDDLPVIYGDSMSGTVKVTGAEVQQRIYSSRTDWWSTDPGPWDDSGNTTYDPLEYPRDALVLQGYTFNQRNMARIQADLRRAYPA